MASAAGTANHGSSARNDQPSRPTTPGSGTRISAQSTSAADMKNTVRWVP